MNLSHDTRTGDDYSFTGTGNRRFSSDGPVIVKTSERHVVGYRVRCKRFIRCPFDSNTAGTVEKSETTVAIVGVDLSPCRASNCRRGRKSRNVTNKTDAVHR